MGLSEIKLNESANEGRYVGNKRSTSKSNSSSSEVSIMLGIFAVCAFLVARTLLFTARVSPVLKDNLINNAERIQFIFIFPLAPKHPKAHVLPILCECENATTKGVVIRGLDIKETEKLIEPLVDSICLKFFSHHSSDDSQIDKIDKSYLKERIKANPISGSRMKGICLGASIFVIKELFKKNPQCEAKLIDCIRPYREGFPAQAAGLQGAMGVFWKAYEESILKMSSNEYSYFYDPLERSRNVKICASLVGLKASTLSR